MNSQLDIELQGRDFEDRDGPCGPGDPEDERVVLELEQEKEEDDSVDLSDLKQMWTTAQAGKTARSHKPYSSVVKLTEDTITFSIGFYVSTVPEDLDYQLESTLGVISAGRVDRRERYLTKIFQTSRCIDLKRTVDFFSYTWQTPLIDKAGVVHSSLPIRYAHGRLIIDEPYFGVARIHLYEKVHYYTVSAVLDLRDEDDNLLSIDNINVTITATYKDEEGETQVEKLKLDIPEAVETALKLCGHKPDLICYQCPSQWRLDIYYNSCDGSILDTNEVDPAEDDTWCLPASTGGQFGHLL